MNQEIDDLAEIGREAIDNSVRFLNILQDVQRRCKNTMEVGSHDDSAVDLATMLNHIINNKLGGNN